MSGVNDKNLEDKLLLLQLKAGSSDAFDALYEKHWENVYSSAFKRMNNTEQARDVTQDVFLQLWLRRNDVVIDNLSAYLFIAVRNTIYKWMEKEKRYLPITDLLIHLEVSRDSADAQLLYHDFLNTYEALIARLTPSQQEIFRMRYHQDLSTKEIAERLNISRKTVQNQLGTSISQLRGNLTTLCVLYMLLF